jgi:hypothetical protein
VCQRQFGRMESIPNPNRSRGSIENAAMEGPGGTTHPARLFGSLFQCIPFLPARRRLGPRTCPGTRTPRTLDPRIRERRRCLRTVRPLQAQEPPVWMEYRTGPCEIRASMRLSIHRRKEGAMSHGRRACRDQRVTRHPRPRQSSSWETTGWRSRRRSSGWRTSSIETIRTTNPGEATVLRRMADEFDYEGMRNLLGQ